jgi:AraC-like DNA-binding protein
LDNYQNNMLFYQANPSAALLPYIKKYWSIENCLEKGQVHTQRIVPSGLMEMTFYFGHVPSLFDKEFSVSSNSVISGQLNTYYDIGISNKLEMFSVTFQPNGASLVFDFAMNELANRNVPLNLLLGVEAELIEEQLMEVSNFQMRVKVMENYFLRKLMNKTQNYALQRVSGAIGLMNVQYGSSSIESLAYKVCVSRKQLERTFKECVGLSPGQFNRVLRFQRSLHFKQCMPELSLTALAHEAGYFDQPYMVNEYKALSGLTPKQYFSVCEPVSDYFT